MPNPLEALQQLCPRCHNAGSFMHRGQSTPCDCPAGRHVVYRNDALKTLTAMYGARQATRWLEDWNPELGGRPFRLLVDDQAPRVFAVIRRLAAAQGIDMPEYAPPAAEPPPVAHLPSLRDTGQERMITQLRTSGRHVAAQLFAENRLDDMEDADRAYVDALMVGTGFLVDGQRVDPARVQVISHGRGRHG